MLTVHRQESVGGGKRSSSDDVISDVIINATHRINYAELSLISATISHTAMLPVNFIRSASFVLYFTTYSR